MRIKVLKNIIKKGNCNISVFQVFSYFYENIIFSSFPMRIKVLKNIIKKKGNYNISIFQNQQYLKINFKTCNKHKKY